MKYIVFSISLFLSFQCLSQITFEKYYGTSGRNNVGFYINEVADGYLLSGSEDNDGVLIKTDFHGDTLWKIYYTNASVECLNITDDNKYLLSGTDYNSPYKAVYRMTDSLGAILWDTIYTSSPFTRYGVASIKHPDGNFILLENDNYPFQEFLRLRKISPLDQSTVWTKEISKISHCSPSSLKLTLDSSIVLASTSFDMPYPKLILAKTLADGNLAWKKEYFYSGDTGIAGNSVEVTSDSGFIVVGYKTFGNPLSDYRLYLLKTDSNGDSLWSKQYLLRNSNAFPDIIKTSDGGFAIIGTVVYPPQGSFFDYRILLMKTDANGDSLWTREYTGLGLCDARKISQTTDGGFAIIGTSTDQTINQNYFYFIKTDSLGNQNNTASVSEFSKALLKIHPNPATNSIQLMMDNNASFSEIEIRNTLGQVIRRITVENTTSFYEVNVSQLPDGLYYCLLKTKNGDRYTSTFLKN